MELSVELKEHPARLRDKVSKELITYNGQTLPMFPNERAVYVNGICQAYITLSERAPVRFVRPQQEGIRRIVEKEVAKLLERELVESVEPSAPEVPEEEEA